jgi:hypothetical protein
MQTTLDAQLVADPMKRLACPACGEHCVRQPITGRPGVRRLRVECLACEFTQDVEIGRNGTTQTVQQPSAPPERRGPSWRPSPKEPRPMKTDTPTEPSPLAATTGCPCPGCVRPQKFSGLCGAHYQRWLKAGRPDQAAWITTAPTIRAAPGSRRSSARSVATQQRPRRKPKAKSRVEPRQTGAKLSESVLVFDVNGSAAKHVVIAGRFVTLLDGDGRVVQQVEARTEASAS